MDPIIIARSHQSQQINLAATRLDPMNLAVGCYRTLWSHQIRNLRQGYFPAGVVVVLVEKSRYFQIQNCFIPLIHFAYYFVILHLVLTQIPYPFSPIIIKVLSTDPANPIIMVVVRHCWLLKVAACFRGVEDCQNHSYPLLGFPAHLVMVMAKCFGPQIQSCFLREELVVNFLPKEVILEEDCQTRNHFNLLVKQ